MRSIQKLPETVCSSMRSGFVVYDLTSIVEELVFNSIDAGATKVDVAVGSGTCYVKVADNGSGITRDGLVLLGERYATSKDYFEDPKSAPKTFGFRGEALASISDVSLLEIVTKATGRPNGYSKVIKSCKCLYLGINDERRDVGTTVTVRDLFYNQPVRRKHIQSNSKKVLQLVKNCMLRIGLVHPKVSFDVIDVESGDELLCLGPSASRLPLLMSGFGVELCNSLDKLNVRDGLLKLSGYISTPCDNVAVKAFQYLYINSRFICKGPIHKLLNHLAASFYSDSQNEKLNKPQMSVVFLLNLDCPRSLYDIAFEPSKTSVEFKDWGPVLAFIENAVTHLWSGTVCTNYQVNCEIGKKRHRNRKSEKPQLPSPQLMDQTEDCNLSYRRDKETRNFKNELYGNTFEYGEHQNPVGFVRDILYTDYDECRVTCREAVNQEYANHLVSFPHQILSTGDCFLENEYFDTDRASTELDASIDSKWQDESPKVLSKFSHRSRDIVFFADDLELGGSSGANEDLRGPFLQRCLSQRSPLYDYKSFSTDEAFNSTHEEIRIPPKWDGDDNDGVVNEEDYINQITEARLPWHSEVSHGCSSSRCICQSEAVAKLFSGDSVNSNCMYSKSLDEKNQLSPDIADKSGNRGCFQQSIGSAWSPLKSDAPVQVKHTDLFFVDDLINRHHRLDESAKYDTSDYREKEFEFYCDKEMGSFSTYSSFSSDWDEYPGWRQDLSSFQGDDNRDESFPSLSGILPYESFKIDWLGSPLNNSISCYQNPSICVDLVKYEGFQVTNQGKLFNGRRKERRHHSAPPFHRGRKKFLSLNDYPTVTVGERKFQTTHVSPYLPEICRTKNSRRSLVSTEQCSTECLVDNSLFDDKPTIKGAADIMQIQPHKMEKDADCDRTCNMHPEEGSVRKEIQDFPESRTKRSIIRPQTAIRHNQYNLESHDPILNISSGILHLAGDSLVPNAIDKSFLDGATVLQQVDKKFIPVVAGGKLAVIDQHAADERILLENLRKKVLSGEMKTIAYLDAERELVLPEIGYQLLQNYAEQIQNWGWICNIHSKHSASFSNNLNAIHRQPALAKLLAVPCVLGVNLNDVDLLEFLQQLADTDGSSTVPPSVLRLLNNKACRGAIMFGDPLLPSECSLLVEELKQTSLCFQCAHGRPTAVPLVDLNMLHEHITKLVSRNRGCDIWHGLRRHKISLKRTAQRINSSR